MLISRFQDHKNPPAQRAWAWGRCSLLLATFIVISLLGCRRIDSEQDTNINVEFANDTERYLFGLRFIELSLNEPQVPAGRSVRLRARAVYKDGSTKAINELISWQLSDPTLASLVGASPDGHEFVTTAAGTLEFYAQFGDFTTSAKLLIGSPIVDILHIFPSSLSLVKGQIAAVSVLASYSDRRVIDVSGEAGLHTASDPLVSVAGLSNDGGLQLRAVQPGVSVLTTSFGGQSATAEITVVSDALQSISVSPQLLSLKLGDRQQFKALGRTVDGFEYDVTAHASWSTASPSKAAFSTPTTPGLLSTIGVGELQVSAAYQGITASTTVYVHTPPVKALVIEPQATSSLPLGEQLALQAVMHFQDGTSLDVTTSCQWVSSDTSKADFSASPPYHHILTGRKEGDTSLMAQCLGYESQKAITVSAPIVKSLIISTFDTGVASPLTSLSVPAGRSRHFKVWGVYSDNRTADLTAIATSPTGPSSYQVMAGLQGGSAVLTLSGLLEASTSVTFQAGGVSSSLPLTVGAPELVSLALSPAATSIALGRTQQYSVTAIYSNSPLPVSLAASAVHWYISYNTSTYSLPPAFVNMTSSPGLVQTLRQGVVTVHAELKGISTTTTLTITPAVIVNITLSALTSLKKGDTSNITAVLNYSDGTTAPANSACADYFFTFSTTRTAGYATSPLSIINDLCLLNSVTALGSQEGVVELALKMEPLSGGGASITSSSPLEFVVRTPCSNSPTVQAYGTLNSHANIFCWYQGAMGNNCSQTCTAAGLNHAAEPTQKLVGSAGTSAQCTALTIKFAAFSAITDFGEATVGPGLGCGVEDYSGLKVGLREVGTPTTAAASDPAVYRICACTP